MASYLLNIAKSMSPFRTPTEDPYDATDRAHSVTPQDLHNESSFDDDQEISALRNTLRLITKKEEAALTEARELEELRTATKQKLAKAESSSSAAENPVDDATVDPAFEHPTISRFEIQDEPPATDGIDRSPRLSPIEHRDEMTPLRGRTLSDRFHEHSSPTSTYSRGAFTLDKSERSRLLAGASQGRGNFSEFDTPMRVGEKAFSKLLAEGSKKLKLPWLYDGKSTQMIVFNKEITDRADIQRFSKILTITKDGEAYDLLQDWTLLTVDDVELHQAELIAVHDADPTWMNQRPLIDMSMMYSMLKSSLSALMLARMAPYEQDIARNGPLLFRHVMAASHLESFDQMSTQVFTFLQPRSLSSYNHDILRFHVKFNEELDNLVLLSKDKKDLLSPSLMRHMLLQTYKTCQCDYFIRNSLPGIERYIHDQQPAILPLQIHVEKEVARLILTEHWKVPEIRQHHGREKKRNLTLAAVTEKDKHKDRGDRGKGKGGGRPWLYEETIDSKNKGQYKGKIWCPGVNHGTVMHRPCWSTHPAGTCLERSKFLASIGKPPSGKGDNAAHKKHAAAYLQLEQARALFANYDPNMDDLPVQLLQLLKE